MRKYFWVLVALGATSCRFFTPPEELDRDARQLMHYLRSDRLESARAMLHVNAPMDTLNKYLAVGRDFIRAFPADSFTIVGWHVTYMGGDTSGDLTYEAKGGGKTALFNVGIVRNGGSPAITTFRWEETKQPLAVANAFTVAGKSATHFAYLILAIFVALTCIAGAVFAYRQRLGLAWIIASLIGVGSFSINWSTGATHVDPFSCHLLGSGYVRSGDVAPWILTWSIPLGTSVMLVAWWQRKRRARAGANSAALRSM